MKDALRASALYGRGLSARRRALPSFLILGAQKAGTTSLYRYLSRHPGIAPAFQKEVHYFDRNFDRGELWYRSFFPRTNQLSREKKITGEATPNYLFDPLVPERVRRTVPSARMIVLLRNPVDRAFSHFRHEVRAGRERRTLHQAIEEELVHDAPRTSYLARGMYAEQLSRWYDAFAKPQLLVLFTELLDRSPKTTCETVLHFLTLGATTKKLRRANVAPPDAIAARDRRFLEAQFADANARLADMLRLELPWPTASGDGSIT